jgi:hypothetical protein
MARVSGMAVMIRNGLNKGEVMIVLFRYFFCKAYYFCIWAFKEKDFPWAWAGMTTSFIFVVTIINLLKLLEVLMFPDRINIYGEYHKYFSLGTAILALFFVKRCNRYLKILEAYKQLPERKRKILRYMSVAYLLI